VLDAGCGTGRLILYIAGVVGPSGSVTGIDLSPHRIEVAAAKINRREHPNVHLLVGRGEDLCEFPDESFDHVCYSSVFHWVDDKDKAAKEAYRVLKHGGNIGITTIDKSHPFAMRKIFDKLFSKELTRVR